MSKNKATRYDEEFKKQTINHMLEENKSLAQMARELSISTSTLHGWKLKYHPNPEKRVLQKASSNVIDKNFVKSQQRKILDLEEENAILKKAMSIFVKSPK